MNNITHKITEPVVKYAHARKRMHFLCGVMIFLAEISAALFIHDVLMHVTLNTAVFSWEAMVVWIGENVEL